MMSNRASTAAGVGGSYGSSVPDRAIHAVRPSRAASWWASRSGRSGTQCAALAAAVPRGEGKEHRPVVDRPRDRTGPRRVGGRRRVVSMLATALRDRSGRSGGTTWLSWSGSTPRTPSNSGNSGNSGMGSVAGVGRPPDLGAPFGVAGVAGVAEVALVKPDGAGEMDVLAMAMMATASLGGHRHHHHPTCRGASSGRATDSHRARAARPCRTPRPGVGTDRMASGKGRGGADGRFDVRHYLNSKFIKKQALRSGGSAAAGDPGRRGDGRVERAGRDQPERAGLVFADEHPARAPGGDRTRAAHRHVRRIGRRPGSGEPSNWISRWRYRIPSGGEPGGIRIGLPRAGTWRRLGVPAPRTDIRTLDEADPAWRTFRSRTTTGWRPSRAGLKGVRSMARRTRLRYDRRR